MLIVCPSCTTAYRIELSTLGAAGRSVRCARCRAVWFASVTDVAPAALALTTGPDGSSAADAPERPPTQDPSAAGEAARAMRVLLGLKSEGVEPTLILWALVRELRGMWQARERERLRSSARGSGWNLAASPSPRALARLKNLPLARLLLQASQTDRVIKGIAPGDAWSALTGLTGGLAGALHAAAESGRVPT